MQELSADTPEATERLLAWETSAWSLEEKELPWMVCCMFHSQGLLTAFPISPSALRRFVGEVAAHMLPNPFHNWRHVFTVTHTAWRFLARSEALRAAMLPLDRLALLLSALVHDLEHPATTNAYLVANRSELAALSLDRSPLEQHHCRVGLRLLEATRLLADMAEPDRLTLRKELIEAARRPRRLWGSAPACGCGFSGPDLPAASTSGRSLCPPSPPL